MILPILVLAVSHPVFFEPNQGLVAGETDWVVRTNRATVYLSSSGAAFDVAGIAHSKPQTMRFRGARKVPGIGEAPTGGVSNFLSKDKPPVRSPHYERVRYREIYPGIDLVYYATPNLEIEYDLEITPGADTTEIDLRFSGFDAVELDATGGITLGIGKGKLIHRRPKAMQGGREVSCSYRRIDAETVRISLGNYDASQPLTVDPVLDFSTFVGGPGSDSLTGIAIDPEGYLYFSGSTESAAAPSLDPFQQPATKVYTSFIMKMTPDADKILFFTAFVSKGDSYTGGIHLDTNGNILLIGNTPSADFPVVNAFQPQFKAPRTSIYVLKLAKDGATILWSSFFGGTGTDLSLGRGMVSGNGDFVFSGQTSSRDIPLVNALQSTRRGFSDCFVAKVGSDGALLFSTYFGGNQSETCFGAIAVDKEQNIWIAGDTISPDFPIVGTNPLQSKPRPGQFSSTPFLLKLAGDGQQILYSTFLGGDAGGSVNDIAIHPNGEIYLSGSILSNQLVLADPFQSTCEARIVDSFGRETLVCSFLMRLDAEGRKLLNSTYFNGTGQSSARRLAIGPDGSLYVIGFTSSNDFPVKDSIQQGQAVNADNRDAYLARFTPDMKSLLFSTFLGGSESDGCADIQFDTQGRLYLACSTASKDLPVNKAFQSKHGGGFDGAVMRLTDPIRLPSIHTVLDGTTREPGPVSPGQTILLIGRDFGVADKLQVTCNGVQAEVLEASGEEIKVLIPTQLQGTALSVIVSSDSLSSAAFHLSLRISE